MEAILENPYILIYEKKISSLKDMLPLLEKAQKPDVRCLLSRRRGKRSACNLGREQIAWHIASLRGQSSGFGDRSQGDAGRHRGGLTGANDQRRPRIKLENISSRLGKAKARDDRQGKHHIVEGSGKNAEHPGRVAQIRRQIEETTSDYDPRETPGAPRELAGGVAVINVGAATETR